MVGIQTSHPARSQVVGAVLCCVVLAIHLHQAQVSSLPRGIDVSSIEGGLSTEDT